MIVLDASAVLAYLGGEPGADVVADNLDGAILGAANLSEVLQKVRSRGANWELASALLRSKNVAIAPVVEQDAEQASLIWKPGAGLSLADRLCLALGERLGATILTADKAWGDRPGVVQIR